MAKRVRVTKRAKKIRRRQRQSRRAYGGGEVNTSVGISPRVVKACRHAKNLGECIQAKMGQKSPIIWNRGIQE